MIGKYIQIVNIPKDSGTSSEFENILNMKIYMVCMNHIISNLKMYNI